MCMSGGGVEVCGSGVWLGGFELCERQQCILRRKKINTFICHIYYNYFQKHRHTFEYLYTKKYLYNIASYNNI